MAVKFDEFETEWTAGETPLILGNDHGGMIPPGESAIVTFSVGFTVPPGEVLISAEATGPNGLHMARTIFAEGRHESMDIRVTNTSDHDVEFVPEQLDALVHVEKAE